MGSSVVLTGGDNPATTRVTEYNEAGWVRDLPPLLTKRQEHGCSYFVNNKGTRVDIDIDYFTPLYSLLNYCPLGWSLSPYNVWNSKN